MCLYGLNFSNLFQDAFVDTVKYNQLIRTPDKGNNYNEFIKCDDITFAYTYVGMYVHMHIEKGNVD